MTTHSDMENNTASSTGASQASWLSSHRKSSSRYVRGLLFDIIKFTLMIFLGIEAVFISDKVITEYLTLVLENNGRITDLLLLIALTLPNVIYIGFPIALLISIYLVLLRRREALEFLMFSVSGRSTISLTGLIAAIGCCSALMSLVLTGYIQPHFRHIFDKTLYNITYLAITEGRFATNRVYQFNDYALFAAEGQVSDVAKNIFVYQKLKNQRYKITTSDRVANRRDQAAPSMNLLLENVTVYEFGQRSAQGVGLSPNKVVNYNRMIDGYPAIEFPQPDPRTKHARTRTSLELLVAGHFPPHISYELSKRLLWGVLCLLAPLLALLAVASTHRSTVILALPAACGLILGGNFGGVYVLKQLAGIGAGITIAAPVAFGALVGITALWLISRMNLACIRPAGVQL